MIKLSGSFRAKQERAALLEEIMTDRDLLQKLGLNITQAACILKISRQAVQYRINGGVNGDAQFSLEMMRSLWEHFKERGDAEKVDLISHEVLAREPRVAEFLQDLLQAKRKLTPVAEVAPTFYAAAE